MNKSNHGMVEEAFLDCCHFYLTEGDFSAFKISLEAIMPENKKLKKLAKEPAPWDERLL